MTLLLKKEEEVCMYDILSAMSECLMDSLDGNKGKGGKAHLFQVQDIPDATVSITIGGRPPHEIFYRKTITFTPSIPSDIAPRRCTCLYVCTGAKATVKCMSCKMYDPTGMGLFCDLCFKQRHPWYRVPHIYIDIEKDESIEYTLKLAHINAEKIRYQKDGKDLLASVQSNMPRMKYLEDDLKVDTNMKILGRKLCSLEERMSNFQLRLRNEVDIYDNKVGKKQENQQRQQSKHEEEMTANTAAASTIAVANHHAIMGEDMNKSVKAIQIQQFVRGCMTRKVISMIYVDRLIRVYDSLSCRDYFYDRVTKTSSWSTPRFLLNKHIDLLYYMKDDEVDDGTTTDASDAMATSKGVTLTKNMKWCAKRTCRRRRAKGNKITYDTAHIIIRNFMRCIYARQRVISVASTIFNRIHDNEMMTHYYADLRTGKTFWNKPNVFLSIEPPFLVFGDDSNNSISPRFNRQKVNKLYL